MSDLLSVDHFSEQLAKNQNPSTRHKQLIAGRTLEKNAIPVDIQIQAELDDLRHLKYELNAFRTKRIFLQNLRDARDVQDLPTAQQAVSAEIKLQKMKSELRKTKAERSALERRFENAVRDLGEASADHLHACQSMKHRIHLYRADTYTDNVEKQIKLGDWESVFRSFDDIEEVDSLQVPHCRTLINLLRKEKLKFEAQSDHNKPQLQQIHQHVRHLENNVDMLKEKQHALNQRIHKFEHSDPAFSKLRHEYELQKQLQHILPSITGVRVADVRVNGVCFEINAMLFVPFVDGTKRDQKTHSLIVKVDENCDTANNVVELCLTPADVRVDDLFGRDENMSLRFVVQTVCARLAEFMARTFQERRTHETEQ
ncbi:hypothetical protein BWQ96_09330 [Gracilariopsis chorda]|uniref:Kinetochore protein SPC25 n=1 Tax=Gracilariopsis chorda TaxID=448386 RepID=A0A2V3IFS3_9FLOR|nr:hypothetical protein BWQ96_09330 [Gracilariopsis chorda]|eukprot:PXF40935.1 hypothetical protein BWQ96_09330 [Gracilariopsis chorda]